MEPKEKLELFLVNGRAIEATSPKQAILIYLDKFYTNQGKIVIERNTMSGIIPL